MSVQTIDRFKESLGEYFRVCYCECAEVLGPSNREACMLNDSLTHEFRSQPCEFSLLGQSDQRALKRLQFRFSHLLVYEVAHGTAVVFLGPTCEKFPEHNLHGITRSLFPG